MANIYQMDLFGGPDEKLKRPRRKKSEMEKEEEREKRAIKKKLEKEKKFEDYWASVGHPQLYMFDDEGNVKLKTENMNYDRLTESQIDEIISKSVKKSLNEEVMSQDYKAALDGVLKKMVLNLSDNEKSFLYDLINNNTWEVVYPLLSTLKQ